MTTSTRLFLIVLCTIAANRACGGDSADDPAEQPDQQTAAAAEHTMTGPVAEDLHMRLTALRPPAPGDSARAAAILVTMRRDLARYGDVRAALADGFRQFVAGAAAPVQHYTKLRWWIQARTTFDPSRPSSLLYNRAEDGSLVLAGAMYTAPPGATEDETGVTHAVVQQHDVAIRHDLAAVDGLLETGARRV